MEEKNTPLVTNFPLGGENRGSLNIGELTYLVQAISDRENARRFGAEMELDCHQDLAEDLCQSLYHALTGSFPSQEELGHIIPRDPD